MFYILWHLNKQKKIMSFGYIFTSSTATLFTTIYTLSLCAFAAPSHVAFETAVCYCMVPCGFIGTTTGTVVYMGLNYLLG